MSGVKLFLVAATALFSLSPVKCGSPRIAHSQYVYKYEHEGKVCVYASFDMSFDIFYDTVDPDPKKEPPPVRMDLPDKNSVQISGACGESERELVLRWQNNSLQMTFGIGRGKWELMELTLVFNLSSTHFNNSKYTGLQSFHTNGTDLFQRNFKTNEYFYCKNCKTYTFGGYNDSVCQDNCQSQCVSNGSYCSSVHMEKSVIFVGDPGQANKRLCLEDYIALQEIIVPIAVGGVLALLLILIFMAYIIAYVRRRRREAKSQYEPVGDF